MEAALLVDRPNAATSHLDGAPALVVSPHPTPLETAAALVLRYSLVIIVLWFGIFKFTPTEAAAIQPLFTHSPLFAWLYQLGSVQAISNLVGATEILVALLISLRPWAPRLSYVGSLGGILMFIVTLSFLFTTPGAFTVVDGLWVPGGAGGFLLKDLTLLGAALHTAADARRAR